MRNKGKICEKMFLLWVNKGNSIIENVESFGEIERISPKLIRITCQEKDEEELESILSSSGLRWAEE